MKKISIIVAIASNNAIGKNNQLLWHVPADMKYFKKITTGHTVIMGKNTFLSLPGGPLVNRRNIVISDDPDDHFKGCVTVNSINEAIELCDEEIECFVIGGASVYRQFLPFATRLYVTKVNKSFEADTFSLRSVQENGLKSQGSCMMIGNGMNFHLNLLFFKEKVNFIP